MLQCCWFHVVNKEPWCTAAFARICIVFLFLDFWRKNHRNKLVVATKILNVCLKQWHKKLNYLSARSRCETNRDSAVPAPPLSLFAFPLVNADLWIPAWEDSLSALEMQCCQSRRSAGRSEKWDLRGAVRPKLECGEMNLAVIGRKWEWRGRGRSRTVVGGWGLWNAGGISSREGSKLRGTSDIDCRHFLLCFFWSVFMACNL